MSSARFEHYEVLQKPDGTLWELGRGAMGVTYKAFDTDLHCEVALKVINPEILGTEGTQQRFLREARAAAQLRHPNIATVLRLGRTEDETYFYAMEFCEGQTIQQFVDAQGAMAVAPALNIASQIAKALVVAEQHSVVHRDIKPANLILSHRADEGLVVKIIDFGLAKALGPGSSAWTSMSMHTAGFVGTAHFSSPEQLEEGQIDVRSDIYSLGATLWFMVTGKPLFSGSVARVMSQHLSAPPPLRELSEAGVPGSVIDLLDCMLRKNPDERPSTAAGLHDQISSVLTRIRNSESRTAESHRAADVAAVGSVIGGRWRLQEECKRFSGGQTFRAVDLHSKGDLVAVAAYDVEAAIDAQTWSRFTVVVQRLRDVPQVFVRAIAVSEFESRPRFAVTEWLNSMPLLMLVRRRGSLTASEMLNVISAVAGALDYAVTHKLEEVELPLSRIHLVMPEALEIARDIDALLAQPITEWKQLRIAVDTIEPHLNAAAADESAFQTLIPGARRYSQQNNVPPETTSAAIRRLASLAYTLSGGIEGGFSSSRYVPLARLSSGGNSLLQEALDPALVRKFSSAGDFHQALAATIDYQPAWKKPAAEPTAKPATIAPRAAKRIPTAWLIGVGTAVIALGIIVVGLLPREKATQRAERTGSPEPSPNATQQPIAAQAPSAIATFSPNAPSVAPSALPTVSASPAQIAQSSIAPTATPWPTYTPSATSVAYATPAVVMPPTPTVPVESEESMRTFVTAYEQHERSRDLDVIIDDYAQQVDYNHHPADHAAIRKDKEGYFDRWPTTDESMLSSIAVQRTGAGEWLAKYKSNFRVQNAIGDWIRGEVENELRARFTAGKFEITAQDGKVTKKEKGSTGTVARGAFIGNWQGMVKDDVNDMGVKRVTTEPCRLEIDSNESEITLHIRGANTRYALVKKATGVYWSGMATDDSNGQYRVTGSILLQANGKSALFNQRIEKVALLPFLKWSEVDSGSIGKAVESGE